MLPLTGQEFNSASDNFIGSCAFIKVFALERRMSGLYKVFFEAAANAFVRCISRTSVAQTYVPPLSKTKEVFEAGSTRSAAHALHKENLLFNHWHL